MTPILHRLILSTLPLLLWLTSFAQDKPLSFHTSKGLTVKVDTRGIYINNKKVHWFDTDELIPDSRRNKLIEDGGTAFLFLEMSDAPNLNKLYGFRISANRADSVVYTNTSDIVDMDGDGYLEFGGADLTEVYSSEDSMYYIPTEYYEIRNGRIHFDTTLTRDRDIWINGIYLAHPADANGN
ncbi:MAG TPA: hypothetical protein VHD83_09760, partial [Puia sp.]|nr:hypothetical protein [Puia sp.]